MIAFIDMEYNTDSDYANKRTDYDIVEIALVVKPDFDSNVTTATYHAYVKPVINNGKLRERIIALTGIKQEQIDNEGITREDMIKQLKQFIVTNKITQIYFYGNDDFAFRLNFKSNKEAKKLLYNLFKKVDSLPFVTVLLKKFKETPSLELMQRVYGIVPDNTDKHTALHDAQELADFIRVCSTEQPISKNISEINRYIYIYLRRTYGQFKQAIDSSGGNKTLLDMCMQGIQDNKSLKEFMPFDVYAQASRTTD